MATRTTKTAAKTAVKAATRPPVKRKPAARKPAAKKAPARVAPVPKAERIKLVRDSFTMPADEYTAIDQLKRRGAALGRPVKKSELLRAGIKALAALADKPFLDALAVVPSIKTGRPKHKKA